MKVVILYRPNSEHGTKTETFVRDFERTYPGQKIELTDIDSKDGSATATLYDVVQYPAMLVLSNDGSFVHSWEGEDFPLMDELASYSEL